MSANWIDSSGGPLLLLPAGLLESWQGIDAPEGRVIHTESQWDPDGPATDYDRACDVEGYLGKIDVGGGHALVLGDEPMATTFLETDEGGILVRWFQADSEEELLTAVRNLDSPPETEEADFLQWTEGPLLLFDSACPGAEVEEDRLVVDLPPGTYLVDAGRVELNETTAAVLVVLTRQDV